MLALLEGRTRLPADLSTRLGLGPTSPPTSYVHACGIKYLGEMYMYSTARRHSSRLSPTRPASQQPARRKLEMGPDYAMHIPQLHYNYSTVQSYPMVCTLNLVSICLPRACVLLPSRSKSRLAGSGSVLFLDSPFGHRKGKMTRPPSRASHRCAVGRRSVYCMGM